MRLKIPFSFDALVHLRRSIETENYFVHPDLKADSAALNCEHKYWEHPLMASSVEEVMTSLMGEEPEPGNDTEEAWRMALK